MIINKKFNNYFYKLIILSMLLIIFSFAYIKKSKRTNILIRHKNNCKVQSHISPIINNYKLSNITNNIFLSLIINFSDSKFNLNNDTLINFIKDLFESVPNDFQFFFLNKSSNCIIQKKTINIIFKQRKFKIFSFCYSNFTQGLTNFVNLIEGKFLILIDKIVKIEKGEFHKIYNITKGSIKNVFKLKFKNNQCFYLIRSKALKDIFDSGKKFNDFKDIINYINASSIPNYNYIQIAYCPNNYYSSLVYTSMISILFSKAYYTYISFYIIIRLNFASKNIKLIESLYEQFDYFNITFIEIDDNRYKKAYTNRYLTKNAFFRLSLGELLPNLKKIIYLDADTICLKDLSNLYNLNFMGKIFLARINTFKNENDNFTVNTGVLLLNLDGMRKMKIEKKVLTLLNNGYRHPIFHDQAIINTFFKNYIGFLPPEYNSFSFNFNKVKEKKILFGRLYDFDSLYFSFKFPYIIHYPGIPDLKIYNEEDWYYFARKSKYFQKRSKNLSDIFNYSLFKI